MDFKEKSAICMIDNNQYLICGGVNTNQTVHVTL